MAFFPLCWCSSLYTPGVMRLGVRERGWLHQQKATMIFFNNICSIFDPNTTKLGLHSCGSWAWHMPKFEVKMNRPFITSFGEGQEWESVCSVFLSAKQSLVCKRLKTPGQLENTNHWCDRCEHFECQIVSEALAQSTRNLNYCRQFTENWTVMPYVISFPKSVTHLQKHVSF